jgi:Tfp pilus assembly protein PilF
MYLLGRIRDCRALLLAGMLLASASAETIHLKNGRTIFADSVREVNGRVEYAIGDNTFALPKSSVISIDTGGSPIVTSAEDIPSLPAQPELAINNPEQLTARLIVNGKLDAAVLNQVEAEGNALKSAYAYSLAAHFEETNGSVETAAKYISRANDILPDNPDVLSHYGSVLLQLGRFKEAESIAERATRLAPESGIAFGILGYAQFQLGKTKESVASLKHSLQLQPDAKVVELLKRAERELATGSDFAQENSSHFSMLYEGGQAPLELRRQIIQTLEHHFDDLSRDLNFTPRETIPVILYSDKQYFDVTQAPTWSGALYDGKLRMPISGLTAMTRDLSRVLKHELTHSFISAIAKGRCPTWLNEGIAQLEEPRSARAQGSRLAALYSTQHNIPLNELEASFIRFTTPEANVAYTQSLFAAEYIRDTYGMSDLAAIVKRLGEGQSIESSLRSTIHSGYGQLEQELTTYLKNSYGD